MFHQPASEKIDYVGHSGNTQSCIDGLLRHLQFDEPIKEAKVISYSEQHALLLYTEERRDTIVVRAGFSSGYPGEGSRGFAYVLSLLEEFNIETDEYDVDGRLFQRLNRCQLTYKDLEKIDKIPPVRPVRIYEYIYSYRSKTALNENCILIPIPLKIIDSRVRDLAVNFWADPDARIQSGFRRLEELLRTRCGLEGHGTTLFQEAFMGKGSILLWVGLTSKEQAARADFFKAAFGSFRNPRAHKELEHSREDLLSEFLTLNQLFRLEHEAIERKEYLDSEPEENAKLE